MNINITKKEIVEPIQAVSGVVERRHSLPILGNVMISAKEGWLKLTTTDMEVEISARIKANIEEEGETTVPARKFFDICRSLADEADINIYTKDQNVVIKSGRSRFKLTTLPAENFPNVEKGVNLKEVEIEGYSLKRLLEKTQFAMAQQDVRYYLNGLMMEGNGEIIRTVATDGHRLAMCEERGEGKKKGDIEQMIIPRKGVLEMCRITGEGKGRVSMGVGKQFIEVKIGNINIISKLIDGKFPDYKNVIPREEVCSRKVYVNREKMKSSLVRASILANEKYRSVRVLIAENVMKIQSHNPEQEEAVEEIEIEFEGEGVEVGFNVNYLIDAITAIESKIVKIEISDNNNSSIIKGKEEEGCEYVVMPMRL